MFSFMGSPNSNKKSFVYWIALVVGVLLIVASPIFFLWKPSVGTAADYESLYFITKDVDVIPLHSHNDEWRDSPLADALTNGAQAVEADVWSFPEEKDLFVGHNRDFLQPDQSLQSVYLDKIFALLKHNNEASLIGDSVKAKQNGVFYDNPEATLYFYVDVKQDGEETVKLLDSQLDQFRKQSFLSRVGKDLKVHYGPVTIIITGNYPLKYITGIAESSFFIDAPMDSIFDPDFETKFNPGTVSLFASGSLMKILEKEKIPFAKDQVAHGLSEAQTSKLKEYIDKVHGFGLKARLWDTPSWPTSLRNKVWLQLLALNVDFLNVDDLEDARSLL